MSATPHYDYREFLEAKIRVDEGCGFEVDPAELNPLLKPVTKLIVPWALRGGRRAVFASFGLHKTNVQIEKQRLIGTRKNCLRLIGMPLGVRTVFQECAAEWFKGDYAVKLKFIRSPEEIDDERTIYLTNYESIRSGKLPLGLFGSLDLDEADVLRSFGSDTFGELLFGDAQKIEYRGVNTATPSPNEYLELLGYAQFLGIMDIGEAKTRWFKRDSEHADKLTLYPHKEREFWLWVSSWALFVQKPSDLGLPDDGYDQPELDVRWHEVPSDHSNAGMTKRGQRLLMKDAAIGVSEEAGERRESLAPRLAKLLELREEAPGAHRLLWHDLEDERVALEKAIPTAVSVYGKQDIDEREQAIIDFSHGRIQELSTKPVLAGAGCNFQKYCWWSIFMGVGHKFRDFIQAIHRIQRFGQEFGGYPQEWLQPGEKPRVRIDIIYSEAQRRVKDNLVRKWEQDIRQRETMAGIIQEYGLSAAAMVEELRQGMGVERREESGQLWRSVNCDSVEEARGAESSSVGLIVTSIPFSNQYQYTPSLNDFGHTDSEEHFFQQMDFLSPELLRVLKPGRVLAVHVKDRVVPGAMTGHGYQTVSPFHAHCILHYQKHGFTYGGMITITTDVVRENNQTYRLGWTEQCKDGSRMGVGMPEYVLLFRKPPTDSSNGYADEPVVKSKEAVAPYVGGVRADQQVGLTPHPVYSLARWQVDAHGYWRSDGNRLITVEDLKGLRKRDIYRAFKQHCLNEVYSFAAHADLCELTNAAGMLPTDFQLLPPHSWHPDVWSDVARMRTLNSTQSVKGREKHICPLQFDIVDRLITRYSNEGEVVLDPFAGLGTVPIRAVALGRQGLGWELNTGYWKDGLTYLRQAEEKLAIPSLFDLAEVPEDEDCEVAV